jgi:hypothetical protein
MPAPLQPDSQREPAPNEKRLICGLALSRHRFRLAARLTLCAALLPFPALAQPAAQSAAPVALTSAEAQSLVQRVLHVEIAALDDSSHPMQYRLRKTSPRYSTTKRIVETRDGDVARLIDINNAPIGPQDEQNEAARLDRLLADPGLQHHRQQSEQNDTERIRKIIRALPDAFLYTYAGVVDTPQGPSYRLTFQPNPAFDPQYLEAQVLKAMAGELWIDVAQQRVTRLDCKRLHDVEVGWGLLGKLDQGGTLLLEQSDVGSHQWRTVRMSMSMNARVLFSTKNWDTTLDLSDYGTVVPGLTYRQAIQLLRTEPATPAPPTIP